MKEFGGTDDLPLRNSVQMQITQIPPQIRVYCPLSIMKFTDDGRQSSYHGMLLPPITHPLSFLPSFVPGLYSQDGLNITRRLLYTSHRFSIPVRKGERVRNATKLLVESALHPSFPWMPHLTTLQPRSPSHWPKLSLMATEISTSSFC